jgi:hypothetical protein
MLGGHLMNLVIKIALYKFDGNIQRGKGHKNGNE